MKLKSKIPLSGYTDIVFTVTDSENDDEDFVITPTCQGDDMEENDTFDFEMVDKREAQIGQRDKGKRVVESDSYGVPPVKVTHF